jgi:Ca2+-transporting ATPase
VALLRDCLLVAVFLWFYRFAGYELAHVRTIVFALLSTDSLFYIFSIKSFGQPLWREDFFDNRFLLASIGLGFVLVVAAVYLPALNRFLETVPLSARDVGIVLAVAAFDVVLIEFVKLVYRARPVAR